MLATVKEDKYCDIWIPLFTPYVTTHALKGFAWNMSQPEMLQFLIGGCNYGGNKIEINRCKNMKTFPGFSSANNQKQRTLEMIMFSSTKNAKRFNGLRITVDVVFPPPEMIWCVWSIHRFNCKMRLLCRQSLVTCQKAKRNQTKLALEPLAGRYFTNRPFRRDFHNPEEVRDKQTFDLTLIPTSLRPVPFARFTPAIEECLPKYRGTSWYETYLEEIREKTKVQ